MQGQLQLSFVNYKKDAYIVVEGKPNADRFFIIREGKVRLSKDVSVVEEEGGSILGPGDFFGVVSTMSSHSQIETAQAVTDVTLISVMKEQYGQLIQNNTQVAMKIIFQFSKRMRYLDEALTRLTLKNNAEEDVSHLYHVAEYYTRQSQYNQAYYAYSRYIRYCPQGENISKARQLVAKIVNIAPAVKTLKLDFKDDEFNRTYPKDSMIFSEGEPGDELFIIQKGSVKIAKIVDNNEVLLAVLKSGDMFGEMALLESKLRAACAVAYEECNLMAVNRANFERMVSNQPQIVARLTTLLSERIWFIYKQLANTLINDPVTRMYDALQMQLEKSRILVGNVPYTFDFGPKELVNMVGMSQHEGGLTFRKIIENKKLQVVNDKIHSTDVSDIIKQADYYRKMEKIDKARRDGTLMK